MDDTGDEGDVELLKEKYEEGKSKIVELEEHNSVLTLEVVDLKHRINQLEGEDFELQQNYETIKEELEQVKEKQREYVAEIIKLKKDRASLELENESQVSKEEYFAIKAENKRLHEELRSIKEDCNFQKKEMQDGNELIDDLKKQIASKNRLLEQTERKYQAEIQGHQHLHEEACQHYELKAEEFEAALASQQSQNERLQGIVKELGEERARLVREKEQPNSPKGISLFEELQMHKEQENEQKIHEITNQLETQVRDLEGDKENLASRLQSAKKEIEVLTKNNENMNKENIEKVRYLESEKENLKNRLQSAESAMAVMTKNNGNVKKQNIEKVEELENKLSESRQKVDQLLEVETKSIKENDEIRNQLLEKKLKICSLENEKVELEKMLVEMNEKQQSKSNDDTTTSVEDDSLNKSEILQKQMEEKTQIVEMLEKKLSETEHELVILQQKEGQMREEIKTKTRRISEDKMKMTSLMSDKRKLERELRISEAIVKEMKENNINVANELQDHIREVRRVEDERNELVEKLEFTEQELNKIKKEQQEKNITKLSRSDDCEKLRNVENIASNKLELLQQEVKSQTLHVRRVEDERNELKEKLQFAEQELNKIKNEQQEKNITKIEELENKLSESRQKVDQLLEVEAKSIKEINEVTKQLYEEKMKYLSLEGGKVELEENLQSSQKEWVQLREHGEKLLNEKTLKISQLSQTNLNLVNEMEVLKQELNDKTQIIEDLKNDLSKLRQVASKLSEKEEKKIKENENLQKQLNDERMKKLFMSTPIKPPSPSSNGMSSYERNILFGEDDDEMLEDSLCQVPAEIQQPPIAPPSGDETVMMSAECEFRSTVPLLQGTLLEPDPEYMLEQRDGGLEKLNEYAKVLFRSAAGCSLLNNTKDEQPSTSAKITEENIKKLPHQRPSSTEWGRWSEDELRRIADLQGRNSIQPPHLQSSYPIETQGKTPRRCGEVVKRGKASDTLRRLTLINEVTTTISPRKRPQPSYATSSPAKISRKEQPCSSSTTVEQSSQPRKSAATFEIPNTPKMKKRGFMGRKAHQMMNSMKKSTSSSGMSSKFGASNQSISSTKSTASTKSNISTRSSTSTKSSASTRSGTSTRSLRPSSQISKSTTNKPSWKPSK